MITVKKDGESEKKEVSDMEGAEKVEKEVLIGVQEDPPNFAMRRFSLKPGGRTPLHSHDWEHEVYVLEGKGEVMTGGGPQTIEAGDAVYVGPGERHRFKAQEELVFLCMVPNRGEPSLEV